jgi:hypothetical protein
MNEGTIYDVTKVQGLKRALEAAAPSCKNIMYYYINPNKMHMLQNLFYLTTALYVSVLIITHHQEHKTTVTTASGNCSYSCLCS